MIQSKLCNLLPMGQVFHEAVLDTESATQPRIKESESLSCPALSVQLYLSGERTKIMIKSQVAESIRRCPGSSLCDTLFNPQHHPVLSGWSNVASMPSFFLFPCDTVSLVLWILGVCLQSSGSYTKSSCCC